MQLQVCARGSVREAVSSTIVTVGIPTAAAVVLSLLAGALQVLNDTVFALSASWHAYISILLVFFAGVGISPLVGPAFRSALHVPPWAAYLVTAGLSALAVAVQTVHMGSAGHAIIVAIITVASALGYAPTVVIPDPIPTPAPPAKGVPTR